MTLRYVSRLLFLAVVLTACASTDPDVITCEDGDENVQFTSVVAYFDTLQVVDLSLSFRANAKIADCDIRAELGDPAESLPIVTWPSEGYLMADLQLSDTSRSGPLRVWYADRLVLDTMLLVVRDLPIEGEAYYRRRLTWEELQPVPSDIEEAYLLDPTRFDSVLEVEIDSLGILIPYRRGFDRGLLRAYSPSQMVVYTTRDLNVGPPPVSVERTGNVVAIALGNSEWHPDDGVLLHLDNNYPQGKSYTLPIAGNLASGEIEQGSYSVSCYSQEAGIYFELGNLLVP